MYLRVRPDSLDHAASGLAALAKSMPQAQLIRRDLEAVRSVPPWVRRRVGDGKLRLGVGDHRNRRGSLGAVSGRPADSPAWARR